MDLFKDTFVKCHPKTGSKTIEYGTAGFRTRAAELDHVVFRMGMLAVMRAKHRNATIGVMITASHNPEEDNGVKLIDPDGEMLEAEWESLATLLANVSDEKISDSLETIASQHNIDISNAAHVVFARDTRASSPALASALQDGITALGAQFIDFGLMTTPQLHYAVRCINSSGRYGTPSEVGYYTKLSNAFKQLYQVSTCNVYNPAMVVDGANGVGAIKMAEMMKYITSTGLSVTVYNDGSTGQLNYMCGADYVKIQQMAPQGLAMSNGVRYASFDGDGDRLVYYYADSCGVFRLLDGDKITSLIAKYLAELVHQVGVKFDIGVVQTAYANGASTDFISKVAGLPIKCVPTGVKHLHHAAQQFDIGVYFEANGHGTVLFKQSTTDEVRRLSNSDQLSEKSRTAAERLLLTVDLINETVGDAISDLLLVECILANFDWDINTWNALYDDLPNRQLKVKVKDRAVIQTTDAERKTTSPAGLQSAIDQVVLKYAPHGRSFVRPSGTEDVVRIYAEADTQLNADVLAYEVGLLAYNMAGGVGDLPKSVAIHLDQHDKLKV